MCEIVKIHIHPIHHNHLVMTEQVEDLDINHITGVSTAPLMYKEIDGVIYSLTPEAIQQCIKARYYIYGGAGCSLNLQIQQHSVSACQVK